MRSVTQMPSRMIPGCVAVVYPHSTGESLGRALRQAGATTVAIVPEHPETIGLAGIHLTGGAWDDVITDTGEVDTLAVQLDGIGIVGVLPGDESAVPLCDALAAALGVPGNDPRTSRCRTDKSAMQDAVARAGLPCPQTAAAACLEEAQAAARQIGFPVVLKPPWSADCVGVRVCRTPGDVQAAWDATFRQRGDLGQVADRLVIQEHLTGTKWTVNTVTVTGGGAAEHVITDLWRDRLDEVDGGHMAWAEMHLVPPGEASAPVAAYVRAVLDAVGVRTGPANTEIMLTSQGPRLIEVAARMSGGGDPDLTVLAIGHSQLSCTVAAITDPEWPRRRRSLAQVYLIAPADGYLDGEVLGKILGLRSVVSASPGLTGGAPVRRTIDGSTAPGYCNLLGPRTQVDADIRRIRKLEETLYNSAPPDGADRLVTIERRLPEGSLERSLRAGVLAGLTSWPKHLPSRWQYDEIGSKLFDEITELEAYYLTAAERSILAARAGEIAAATGAVTLVDLGCGLSASKMRPLLDALREAGSLRRYAAVDVSEAALAGACRGVLAEYPGIGVQAMLSDYEQRLDLPEDGKPRLVAFLGTSLGNLAPEGRGRFLVAVRDALGGGDALLLGTDLVKDPAVLLAAYEAGDPGGVVAQCTCNVLHRLNRDLGADFDAGGFRHVVAWDERNEWIEMRLRALRAQVVSVPALGLQVNFARGEEMRTEISAKFRRSGLQAELAAAGLVMQRWWTDGQFGLSLSVPQ
jgi:L-histidine Nalpha-methyltransferase